MLTDKINRSVAGIRGVLKDCGGKMADSGSIIFKFRRARVANVKVTDVDRDQLLTIALDAGAEDVIEPSLDEDDFEEDMSDRYGNCFPHILFSSIHAFSLLKALLFYDKGLLC